MLAVTQIKQQYSLGRHPYISQHYSAVQLLFKTFLDLPTLWQGTVRIGLLFTTQLRMATLG